MPLMAGEPAVVLARMLAGEVLISEPLARKEGLAPGDSVRVLGPSGPFDLRIAGVTYDYTSEGGTAFLDLPAFARHIGPGPTNNMALFVVPGQEVEAAVDELKAAYRGQPLTFRSNRKLREEILEIFDQTFAVTRILQGMSLLIAVCGISLTLLILARERVAELALLRALGAARRQVFGLFVGEGLSMAVIGLILGLIGGLGLAAVLILVINRAYFGWTIQPSWPGRELATAVATILLASAGASLYPAWRGSLAEASELSRDDV